MELKERVSRSSDGLQIKATVALLQESLPGKMNPSEISGCPPGMEDIFMGGGLSQGAIGTVTTDIISDSSKHSTFVERLKRDRSVKSKFRRVRGKSAE